MIYLNKNMKAIVKLDIDFKHILNDNFFFF